MSHRQVPNPKGLSFQQMDELTLLACMIAGEARGESLAGKIAVAYTARNRVLANTWFGYGWHGVILKEYQFSCFLENDPNCKKLLDPELNFGKRVWTECYQAACAVYFGFVPDPTKDADHYHTTTISPYWKDNSKVTVTLGNHVFYRLRA